MGVGGGRDAGVGRDADPDATVYAGSGAGFDADPDADPDATVYAPSAPSRTAPAPRRAAEPVRNAVPSPSQTSYYGYGYGGAAGSGSRGNHRGPNLKRITLVLVGALVALIVFAVVSSCVSEAVSSMAAGASSGAASGSATTTTSKTGTPTTGTGGSGTPKSTGSSSDTGIDLDGVTETLGGAADAAKEVAQDLGDVAQGVVSKLPSQVKEVLSSK